MLPPRPVIARPCPEYSDRTLGITTKQPCAACADCLTQTESERIPCFLRASCAQAFEEAALVNVHIHQFQAGGAVVDAAALEQFQRQWATYGKVVEHDYLAHRQVGALLHGTLDSRFTSGFSFLDIAC